MKRPKSPKKKPGGRAKKKVTKVETESERKARLEKWVPQIVKIAEQVYYSNFEKYHPAFDLDEIKSLSNTAFMNVIDHPEVPGKEHGGFLRTVFIRFVIDNLRKS